MHYLVRLIVEADSVEEACNRANLVMMDLVEWNEFDWYRETSNGSSWEDCWKPARLDSQEARDWLKDAMNAQYGAFKRAIATVRLMLDRYDDEQIFNEEFEPMDGHYLSRYQFSAASGYHANACYIFGKGGESIANQAQLDLYLKDTSRLWVVQVDCHN